MKTIGAELRSELRVLLPGTYDILKAGNLTVHDAVRCVVLEGSRGLKGGCRDDSDVDLSLLVDTETICTASNPDAFLRDVVSTTLDHWRSPLELDTAVVFDKEGCGLACFGARRFADLSCRHIHPDCLGIFKIQKGFDGFVPDIGLEVERIYPLLPVWSRG